MKTLTLVTIMGVMMLNNMAFGQPVKDLPKMELRARQPFNYPVDPLYVTTMSDYDISLLLFRTWFNYDDGRVALPDLISSWRFDEKSGAYEFTISPEAKWSDGRPVSPADLRSNLQRAIDNKTTYGQGIKEVMNISTFTEVSKNSFRIRTKDGKPKEAFFQRLGSIFLAVASPSDFPQSGGRMVSNKVSVGPYQISSASADELELKPNPQFHGLNKKAPASIRIRKPDPNFDLMAFLDEKTWENYIQINTIIPPDAAKKLTSSGLPYWTRGYDRVSLLKPLGKGSELGKRREILKSLSWEFQQLEIQKFEMTVQRAECLQPFGYPLFQKIAFPKPSTQSFLNTTISVLAPATYYGEFHRAYIERAATKLGIKVIWKAVELAQFYREFPTTSDYDFLLINFGVADPEPTTWMGLLFSDNNFISFDESDKAEFKKISASKTKEKEVIKYKTLLEKMALRGGFLPLFHFSTLSIGHRNLSFKAIRELDETVNFSKVIME